jgi:hypothetical protein
VPFSFADLQPDCTSSDLQNLGISRGKVRYVPRSAADSNTSPETSSGELCLVVLVEDNGGVGRLESGMYGFEK